MLTTVAAFLPLALMPGVGDFMRVVPIVVSVALLISLVEAFWLLPSHIVRGQHGFTGRTRSQMVRDRLTARLRGLYRKSLVAVLKKANSALPPSRYCWLLLSECWRWIGKSGLLW